MSTSSGNGSGADVERQQKKPRLLKQGNLAAWRKSPSPSSSLVQSDPRCLLVIGGDSLTHVLRYLAPRDVCKSEMSCKLMRQAAGPVIGGMTREMNATCDSVSVGHGSRTKLLRYLAAKEMSDRVRSQLMAHTSIIKRDGWNPPPRCAPCSCFGCESFPQMIDESVFNTDGEAYEVYLSFFDVRETSTPYFQGFVTLEDVDDLPYSFYVDLNDFVHKSRWKEMKDVHVLSGTLTEREMRMKFWGRKWEHLGVAAVAVHKERCKVSFLGAAMNFTEAFGRLYRWGENEYDGMRPLLHVQHEVHDDIADPNYLSSLSRSTRFVAATTEFCFYYENEAGGERNMHLELRFHGDRFHDGINWEKGKEKDHILLGGRRKTTYDEWIDSEENEEPGGWW